MDSTSLCTPPPVIPVSEVLDSIYDDNTCDGKLTTRQNTPYGGI